MKLRALKEVYYAGQTRQPGDEFDCDDAGACLIWSAPDLPGGPIVSVVATETRAMKADPEPALAPVPPVAYDIKEREREDPKPEGEGVKRYYRRRDMKAE